MTKSKTRLTKKRNFLFYLQQKKQKTGAISMEPLNDGDVEIDNYIKDQSRFVEVWVFEDKQGNTYRICCDQDGEDWIEE